MKKIVLSFILTMVLSATDSFAQSLDLNDLGAQVQTEDVAGKIIHCRVFRVSPNFNGIGTIIFNFEFDIVKPTVDTLSGYLYYSLNFDRVRTGFLELRSEDWINDKTQIKFSVQELQDFGYHKELVLDLNNLTVTTANHLGHQVTSGDCKQKDIKQQ